MQERSVKRQRSEIGSAAATRSLLIKRLSRARRASQPSVAIAIWTLSSHIGVQKSWRTNREEGATPNRNRGGGRVESLNTLLRTTIAAIRSSGAPFWIY